jgi:hypothetical protein
MTDSGHAVILGRPLAAGGQGDVFAVTSPPGMVFKRYRNSALATEPALRRLTVMTGHPPPRWCEPGSGHLTLAWPANVVFEAGRFAGFVMPAVDTEHTVGLHQVTNPAARRAGTGAAAWTRGFSWRYLVAAAANLARATAALHAAGVVIGDFNESNIRVWHDARVTLLDCDSMQVRDPASGDWFLCRVGRPEFTPPELREADWDTVVRHPSSDLFALAIHVYQLLLEGEHPFHGVWHGDDDSPGESELAARGIWAHGGGLLSPRPGAVSASLLPPSVIALFAQAFENGAADPDARPTAAAWQLALDTLAGQLRRCAADPAHFYPAGQDACPWCAYTPPTPIAVTDAPRISDARPPPPPAPVVRRTGRRLAALAAAVVIVITGITIGVHAASSARPVSSHGPRPTRTLGEGFGVEAVAFSPDGKSLATGEIAGTVLWNAATWRGTTAFGYGSSLANEVAEVNAVAFSPRGTTLATGGSLGSTVLWNTATGRSIATLSDPASGSSHGVAAVAFSPSGKLLATGDDDARTYLWNVATRQRTATLSDPAAGADYAGVAALAFSPDGKTLAVGDQDGNTYLWNVATGHRTAELVDGQSIGGVAFSPDGGTLATGDADGAVYLWNVAARRNPVVLYDPDSLTSPYPLRGISAVAFSPDGSTLATADGAGNIYLWDVASRRVAATFADPETGFDGVRAMAFSPDGSVLVTGDSNGKAYVWTLGHRTARR